MLIIRLIIALLAIAMIVVGLVGMISPIPFGFVLILLGIVILSLVDPAARPLLRWLRRKWRWLDQQLDKAQETAPSSIARPLSETDPEENHDGS